MGTKPCSRPDCDKVNYITKIYFLLLKQQLIDVEKIIEMEAWRRR